MGNKENNKYFVPVEVKSRTFSKWVPEIKTYEYKLFANEAETKFSHLKFLDINGYIIGTHMHIKLQTIYDKAALQVKNNTYKAVSELKNAVDEVAVLAVEAVAEIKDDVSKTAKQTAGFAANIYGNIKSLVKDKFSREEDVQVETKQEETDKTLN